MPLPRAIQAGDEQANAYYQQNQSDQGEGDEAPTPTGEDEQPSQDEQEAPAKPEPEAPKQDDERLWEQRYKSFKGQADAELGRMNQRVKEADQRSSQLEKQLQALQQKLESLEETKQEEQARRQELEYQVTPEEVETYGQELIDVQRKVAHQVLNDARKVWDVERQSLLNRIEELQQSVGNVSQSVGDTAKQHFFAQLTQAVPEWQTVNQDQGFIEWLSEADDFSGLKRQQILDAAAERNDVARVAHVFRAYMQQTGQAAQQPSGKQQELARQVSPSKARGSSGNAATETRGKKVWSQAEIGQFYDQLARGRLSQDEASKIEHEINQAVAEGRVAL